MSIVYLKRRTFIKRGGQTLLAALAAPALSDALSISSAASTGIQLQYVSSGGSAFDDDGSIFEGPGRGFISDITASTLEAAGYISIINGTATIPTELFQIYISWSDIETADGVYSFTNLDAIMARLSALGKRAIWRLDCSMGDSTRTTYYPQWLINEITPSSDLRQITYKDGSVHTEISYENAIFQQKLTSFIQALANRYDGNSALEYIDLRVVARFGEWAGWGNADDFPFQTQIATLTILLNIYNNAFTKTTLCMEVAGSSFTVPDPILSNGGNPNTDMNNWVYNLIIEPTYPNFMIRTDTNTATADYFSNSFYPTTSSLTSWLFERFSQRIPTTYEGLGSWRTYSNVVISPDIFFTNAIFRLRSNYGYINNLDAVALWPTFFESMYGTVSDRLERNYAYRVRPAHVTWEVGSSGGNNYLNVTHCWVNTGTGRAPNKLYPKIVLIDNLSGSKVATHYVTTTPLNTLRNSDYFEFQTVIEIPPGYGPNYTLQILMTITGTSVPLPMPAAGSPDGVSVTIPMSTNPDGKGGGTIQGWSGQTSITDTLLSASLSYEAEASWISTNGTVVRSPAGGPISPRLESITASPGAVLEWIKLYIPLAGTYNFCVDVQAQNATTLSATIGTAQVNIPVPSGGSGWSTNAPVKCSASVTLAQGVQNITLNVPSTLTGGLNIDRIRLEMPASGGSQIALGASYQLLATRLAQSSLSSVQIQTMPWWTQYWNNIKNNSSLASQVTATSPITIADINVNSANQLSGFKTGAWLTMAPLFIHDQGTYQVTIGATITGTPLPTVTLCIDGFPVLSNVVLTSQGSGRYLIGSIPMVEGVHEVQLNIVSATSGNWTVMTDIKFQ